MTSDTGRSGIPDWLPAYSEAWNSHDPAKVLAFLTEDVVFDDKGLGERLEGTDAVRAMLVDLTASMSSDYRLDLGDLIVGTDDLWAAEWTMSGTNDREDETRGLPNTGRPFRIQGLSIGAAARREDRRGTPVLEHGRLPDPGRPDAGGSRAGDPVTGWLGDGAVGRRVVRDSERGSRRWAPHVAKRSRFSRSARIAMPGPQDVAAEAETL